MASGSAVGDPGVLDAYASSLVDSAEQIRWGASRLTVALDVLAGSGSEFLGPLGDHGGAVGQVGSGLLLLAERVRSIAKAFRAADSGKLGVAKAAVRPAIVPNLLAFKPGGSSYSGGGKPNDVASFVSVSGVVPGPGNWAGLPAALIARGKSIGERILKEGESNVKLSVADEVALGAFWWDCQSQGVADRRATEPLYRIGQLLHAPTLGRVVGQAQVNAIAAFGNAELLLPRGVDAALEFLDSDAARALSNVELQTELLKRCRVGNPVEASALETWLTFQVGTAAQAMMRGGAAFPSSDVMTAERWWGWTVPFPVEPWVARLGGLVSGNFSSPQPLVGYLKPVSVLTGWFSGKAVTAVDRRVGGVVELESLTGIQKFLVGLVVVGVVSAAVFSGVAEVSGLAFASAVAAGTLTALEASVLTMIIAGATAGVAGGVASRILAVVEGDLDPKEIWTLRGVLTDAAIGAVFTVASHAIATKIKELVALGKQGGVPALKARLAKFIAERRTFAQNERGSVVPTVSKSAAQVGLNPKVPGSGVSASTPTEILFGAGKLSNRLTAILEKIPEEGAVTIVKKGQFSLRDLAALTAQTGDEFAIFTRGPQRMIIRGTKSTVPIFEEDAAKLAAEGWRWSGHSHPGTQRYILKASEGDMAVLGASGGKMSVIVNSVGEFSQFTPAGDLLSSWLP
jgi:hypothetical protein